MHSATKADEHKHRRRVHALGDTSPMLRPCEAADGRGAINTGPDTYHENRIEWNAELLKTNTLTR